MTTPATDDAVSASGAANVKERTFLFGPTQGLVGIETLAQRHGAGARADVPPAVVLLNAGVIHRIGPHRVTVALARRLARAGHDVLRFDLSGVGDSRPRATGTSYEASVADDVRAALDHLETAVGARRFVVGGICSGADNSVRAALGDTRVVGVALLDPYAYRTPGYYLRHLQARAPHLDTWRNLARRGWSAAGALARRRLGADAAPETWRKRVPQYSRRFPPRDVFAASLRRLLDRGTDVLLVYSGSMTQFNHQRQFDEAFRPYGLAGRASCLFLPDVNHTYTELGAQRLLGDTLVEWIASLPRSLAAAV